VSEEYEKYAAIAHLPYKQRIGLEPIPTPLRFGEIDQDTRLDLWDAIDAWLNVDCTYTEYRGWSYSDEFRMTCIFYYRDYKKINITIARHQLDDGPAGFIRELREEIFFGSPANVAQLVEYLLRSRMLDGAKELLKDALTKENRPYFVHDYGDLPTIFPKNTQEEHDALVENFEAFAEEIFRGAKEHMRKASEALSKSLYGDTIREAIHAVESAAKLIAGKEEGTLYDALKAVRKALHPQLEQSIRNLYNFANGEEGIRHALGKSEQPNVSQEEAILVFSTCAAIVGFLIRSFPEKALVSAL
jgi:hypothetical protein